MTYQLAGNHTEAIKLASEAKEQLQKLDHSNFKVVPPGMKWPEGRYLPFDFIPREWSLAFLNFVLGDAYLAAKNYQAAREAHSESLAAYRNLGVDEDASLPLTSLGKLAILEGNYDEARTLLEESLAIREKAHTEWFVAITLTTLSDLARYQGDYERVEKLAQRGLKIFRRQNNTGGIAWALYDLACAALYRGDLARASALFKESLPLRKEQGNKMQIAEDLLGLSEVAVARSMPQRAVRLLGAVGAILDEGIHLDKFEQEVFDQSTANLRAEVGEAEYGALWDRGHSLTLDEAIEYALRDVDLR